MKKVVKYVIVLMIGLVIGNAITMNKLSMKVTDETDEGMMITVTSYGQDYTYYIDK